MFFSTSSRGAHEPPALSSSLSTPSEFDLFLARTNRHYPSAEERARREAVHDANVANVRRWNEEHSGRTTFALNERFLDMETKEVMRIRGGHVPDDDDEDDSFTVYQVPKDFDPSTLPESFDWRDHLVGSVGPIKDQGFCGSCWAFSLISSLESHWRITHGESVTLPEQFVNDCAWSDSTHACDGGDSGYAAKALINRFDGRVPTRDEYGGYLSVDGACYNGEGGSASPSRGVRLTDWVVLPSRDDIATKHALYTKGPLAVSLNVVDEALYYANGVLDVASCAKNGEKNLDHAVNLVGWGVDELPDGSKASHWILRNSWSDLWGDSGYFKVRMGERDCGVTTNAGFPVVEGPLEQSSSESLVAVATS
ncbi:hypothetical protein ACHAWF_017188 [Thalassiosira exigua]